jgi:hypothetical protein
MRKRAVSNLALLIAPLAGLFVLTQIGAKDAEPKKETPPPKAEAPATPVKPKPLSAEVKKGLAYLVNQQHDDGGWGQGGGWRQADKGGRVEGAQVADPSDLGSTSIAVLALLRAGNTTKEGEYAKNVAKGVDFILSRIEKCDNDGLYVTDVRNTQLQVKIGPYVDTFLAQLVMSELKGKMEGDKGEKRLVACFDKTMAKIAKHQKADGNFEKNEAWASTLSMALCSKGINRAAQMGFGVDSTVLARDQKANTDGLDLKKGDFSAPTTGPTAKPSDAGVAIYATSGKTSGLAEAVNTLKKDEKKNKEILADPKAPKEDKDRAEKSLERLKDAETAQQAAVKGLVTRLEDPNFVQGFGSNGGEEYLSYMNISETLVVKGGKEWEMWDKKATETLVRVQDKDGGWSGQHCITGRTFCTATALLTLMADRAPIPVIKMEQKKEEKKK